MNFLKEEHTTCTYLYYLHSKVIHINTLSSSVFKNQLDLLAGYFVWTKQCKVQSLSIQWKTFCFVYMRFWHMITEL